MPEPEFTLEVDAFLRDCAGESPEDPSTLPSTEIDDGLLLAYVRGELSDAERETLEAVLAEDPEARALLREHMRQAREGERVQSIDTARRRRTRWTMATTIAVAASIGLFVWPYDAEHRSTSLAPLYSRGAIANVRGPSDEAPSVVRVDAHSQLAFGYKPSTFVSSVTGYLANERAGTVRPLLHEVETVKKPSDGVEVRLSIGPLQLTPGPYRLYWVFGSTPERPPENLTTDALASWLDAANVEWDVRQIEVVNP